VDWVKSMTDYYNDFAVATGSDAMEVMFKRGNALAGKLEEHGFIPDAMLPQLTRKPVQAKKIAGDLVKAGLWEKVRGGYQIVNFAKVNDELERLVAKKKRDRDRKRAERSASRAVSEDASGDSPAPRPVDRLLIQEEELEVDAAAAAGGGRTATLPAAVEILRAALEAHKLVVRWDLLTVDHVSTIETLIEAHGDGPLVKSALSQYQPDRPPATAQAWIGGWQQLRKPGDLAVVQAAPCPEPGHSGTTRRCNQCASEQKAAR
jgi:hypothetical protein